MEETSLYPVANLKERYGIGKQAEINRRKHLGIKPSKVEGTYYVTQSQLDLLDSLDQWLTQKGGKMKDFDPSLAVESTDKPTRLDSEDIPATDYQEATLIEREEEAKPEWDLLLEMLAEKLSPPRSLLENWRELEEASEKGWLLTSKQVHKLAGAKPHGSKWQRGSFVFTKAGKIGRETAWLVEKM
jgi:hypothetical protein